MKEAQKQIILTGDRPTGRLHLGHYVGSLKRRVELQNSGKFDEINILIADDQALTDNADNPGKIRDNIINVVLDYLSVGSGYYGTSVQKSHCKSGNADARIRGRGTSGRFLHLSRIPGGRHHRFRCYSRSRRRGPASHDRADQGDRTEVQ